MAFVCRDILKAQAGFTRFAIDAENLKWARDYADILKVKLKEYSLDLVYETSHDPATTDFTPIFKAAQAAKAQALLEIISNQAGFVIVKQWRDQRVPMALAGNDNPPYLVSSFWKDTEGKCKYELSAYTKAPLSSKSLPFWDKFEKRYGETPFYTGTGAYDSVYLVKAAAGSRPVPRPTPWWPRSKRSITRGSSGASGFDKEHEVIAGRTPCPFRTGSGWATSKRSPSGRRSSRTASTSRRTG